MYIVIKTKLYLCQDVEFCKWCKPKGIYYRYNASSLPYNDMLHSLRFK